MKNIVFKATVYHEGSAGLIELREYTNTRLSALTELNIISTDDINGLRFGTKLQTLRLHVDDSVTSLQPLCHCKELQMLVVSGSSVSSLDGLQHLDKLRYVDVCDTAVADLTPLESCKNLRVIWATNTKAPLPRCPSLCAYYSNGFRVEPPEPRRKCMAAINEYLRQFNERKRNRLRYVVSIQ